jgi:NitT/TauT family transport system permease protein
VSGVRDRAGRDPVANTPGRGTPGIPARRGRALLTPLRLTAEGLVGFVAVAALWELALSTGFIKRSAAPSVQQFLAALGASLHQGILSATVATIESWAITLALSVAIGGLIGLLAGLSKWLDAATSVVFDFVRPLPPIALLPAVIVVVGIGRPLELVVGITGAVWPVLLGAHYGVSQTDPQMIDTGRSVQLSRTKMVARVVLPSALPSIVTGIRLSAIIALAVVVGVEIVGGTGAGIGTYIETATSSGATNQAYAGAFAAAVLGLAITGFFFLAERRAIRWTPDHR